ncbi:MAG: pirin family protein [Deltaproteobacteria bacterium]|nr:pirin family protein [Deltaproteobacteria bacterium]
MITLRRSTERHYSRRRKRELWHTFYAEDPSDELAEGFGALETLCEYRLEPNADVPIHAHRETDMITYVHKGALTQENSERCTGVIYASEFQRMTTARRDRCRERNASQVNRTHLFRVLLSPSRSERDFVQEQKYFSAAERRGVLRIVASPDGRKGSLVVHSNVLIYSSIVDVGLHLVHELHQERSAWLHVVHGEITLGDLVLITGDGVGVTTEPAVSFTAREESEILLIDLSEQPATG